MIECACGQTYDVDPAKNEEEFYSECECGDVTCDDCCAPPVNGEPRTCEGCG